jgi:glycosyltransferase involved in cell wall biosynthesis
MTDPAAGDVRRALRAAVDEALTANPAYGYQIKSAFYGEAVELTLEKNGAPFAVWLRPAHDDTAAFRQTAGLKVGYSGEAPDPGAYKLLGALCDRVARWEAALPAGALARLFDALPPAPAAVDPAAPSVDPGVQAWLEQATITPLHHDWLPERERRLAERLAALAPRPRRVLLVNATKGLPYYPSVVDFFAALQRAHPAVQVTSASYFPTIYQFHQGVTRKGLRVAPLAEVEGWGADDFNRFDVVLLVGPSDLAARLMAMPGLAARLVLLDLAFYHQLIDQYPKKFYNSEDVIEDKAAQRNRVVCYSCQPEAKVRRDLDGFCRFDLVDWRWFNYIPLGFAYGRYYQSDRTLFDVALLGSVNRDYARLDPALLGGVRFLFLGSIEKVPDLLRLRDRIDLTVAPQVDPDVYARLLSLCRCVAMPLLWSPHHSVLNAFVSLLDAVASGVPLVIGRHEGAARIEREGLPAVFYDDRVPGDFSHQLAGLLADDARAREVGARALAFGRESLDVYRVLEAILTEQIL